MLAFLEVSERKRLVGERQAGRWHIQGHWPLTLAGKNRRTESPFFSLPPFCLKQALGSTRNCEGRLAALGGTEIGEGDWCPCLEGDPQRREPPLRKHLSLPAWVQSCQAYWQGPQRPGEKTSSLRGVMPWALVMEVLARVTVSTDGSSLRAHALTPTCSAFPASPDLSPRLVHPPILFQH